MQMAPQSIEPADSVTKLLEVVRDPAGFERKLKELQVAEARARAARDEATKTAAEAKQAIARTASADAALQAREKALSAREEKVHLRENELAAADDRFARNQENAAVALEADKAKLASAATVHAQREHEMNNREMKVAAREGTLSKIEDGWREKHKKLDADLAEVAALKKKLQDAAKHIGAAIGV